MIDFPDRFLVLDCPMCAGAAEKTPSGDAWETSATNEHRPHGAADSPAKWVQPPRGRIGVMNWWSRPATSATN